MLVGACSKAELGTGWGSSPTRHDDVVASSVGGSRFYKTFLPGWHDTNAEASTLTGWREVPRLRPAENFAGLSLPGSS